MEKKVAKKSEIKVPASKTSLQKNNKKFWLIGGILLVAILALFLYSSGMPQTSTTDKTIQAQGLDKVVAKVNGEDVTQGDVKRVQSILLAQTGTNIDENQAIERAINEKLMLTEANNENIDVSMEDAENKLVELANQKGVSMEEIKAKSDEIGSDYNNELEIYREQLVIGELLKADLPSTEVSTEEAKAYYDSHKETLFKDGVIRPFDEIEEDLKAALSQQKFQSTMTSYLGELRADAEIEYLN